MTRLLTITALTAALVGALAAPASAFLIPHPEGSKVVLDVSVGPNYWVAGIPPGRFVLRGNGDVVLRELGSDTVRRFRITEEGVQIVLREARDARLFNDDPDYGEAHVTDQGTTTVRLRAAGEKTDVSVYALDLEAGDSGIEESLLIGRRALRALVDDVTDPEFFADVVAA